MNQSILFQIYHEAKKFGKVYNIHVVCAYGGGSMWEQCKACEEGAEIIVATPVSEADDFDGLVQDSSNSSALAMELLLSCTKP